MARLLPVPALGWGTLGQMTVCLSFETGRKRGGGCLCPSVCLYLHVYSLSCTHPPSEKPLSSCLLRDCRVGDFSCSCSFMMKGERLCFLLVSVFNCRDIISTNSPWPRLVLIKGLFYPSCFLFPSASPPPSLPQHKVT